MKICIAGLRGIPDVMGGVETHCQELFPRMKRLDLTHEYTLLARKPYVRSGPYEYDRIKVVPLPCWRNKYLEAASNTLLAVLYARFVTRADVFHVHAIGPALFAPLARMLGMRLVVTHHGKDYDRDKWNGFAKWCLQLGEHYAVRNADKVIVVSPSLAADLKRRYPKQAEKVSYIPNGVSTMPDAAVADGGLCSRFGLEKGRYVLGVGRLVPEKGFHELIAAFQKRNDEGLKLVIAGNADHEDAYSASLLRAATDDVVFTGFQTGAALRWLYANASLFVLPSHHEGLPIAALEAASLGTPVLLSDIPANKDLGLPEAHYFPAGDVEALRARLNADHRALTPDAARIAGRFNWDAIASATADVYAHVT
jgi:glycosyltransferase involved in cell wall biosynthesis